MGLRKARKEVKYLMNTYIVHVYTPTVYELEADTQKEAEKQALANFKKEKGDTWFLPFVETWIMPVVYKGKSMHQIELEKLGKEKA